MALAHLHVDTTPAGVRTITLDRPERLNAVNPALADALRVPSTRRRSTMRCAWS
jgi:enoyl-CoA hydratase/carnithine racemase